MLNEVSQLTHTSKIRFAKCFASCLAAFGLLFVLNSCEDSSPTAELGSRTPFLAGSAIDEEILPESLEVFPSQLALILGESAKISIVAVFPEGVREEITLSDDLSKNISDESILNFDPASSKANGMKVGSSSITFSYQGLEQTLPIAVTGAQIKAIDIELASTDHIAGINTCVEASVVLSDFTSLQITGSVQWSSSNDDIAIFIAGSDNAACFDLVAEGDVELTVIYGEFSESVSITVKPAILQEIIIDTPLLVMPAKTEARLSVTGIYSDDSVKDITFASKWSIDDTATASFEKVDETANIIAVAKGSAKLKVQVGKIIAESQIVVNSAALLSLKILPDATTIPIGQNETMKAIGTYTDGNEVDLTSLATWTSSDPGIITISNANLLQGFSESVSTGISTLTADYLDISGSTTLQILPATLFSVEVFPASVSLPKGLSQNFTVIGTYSDGNSLDLTDQAVWSSTNPTFMTVSNVDGFKGKGLAVNSGNVSIRATIGSFSATSAVTVSNANLISIAFLPENPTIRHGLSQTLVALGTYTDGSTLSISNSVLWYTDYSNPIHDRIAYLSNTAPDKGKVFTIGSGLIELVANLDGIEHRTLLTVTEKEVQNLILSPISGTFIDIGLTQQYSATAIFTDGSTEDVTDTTGHPTFIGTWTSNNGGIGAMNLGGTPGLVDAVSEGTATMNFVLNTPWGNFSKSAALTVRSRCITGTRNGNFCWYLGNIGESCDDVCTGTGANYHTATLDYVGSAGDDNQCREVLVGLGFAISNLDQTAATNGNGDGLGCAYINAVTTTIRYLLPATDSSHSDAGIKRVCACDQ